MRMPVVLVVDDDDDMIELVRATLAECNVDVWAAHSGPDAMSVLLGQHVDLVLLDIMMPDMNGFAILEMIRFVPRLINLPVVVCTAHAGRHEVDRARHLNATAVLSKPLSPAILRQHVQSQLGLQEAVLERPHT